MQLQTQFAPLHRETRAILHTKTLLGEAYIALAPGDPRAAAIGDGGRWARARSSPPSGSSDVLRPSARRPAVGSSAGRRLRPRVRGRGEDLNQSLGWSVPAMANLGRLLQTLNGQRAELAQLFGNAGQVLSAVGSRQGALQAAIPPGTRSSG